jgi:hypothetical protein
VSVCNLEVLVGSRHRPDSRWRLWAASEDGFRDLADRLGRIVPAFTGLTVAKDKPLWIAPGATAEGVALPESGESDIPF